MSTSGSVDACAGGVIAPARPYLPPSMFLALGCACGAAAALGFAWCCFASVGFVPTAFGVSGLAAATLLFAFLYACGECLTFGRYAAAFAFGLFLGVCSGAFAAFGRSASYDRLKASSLGGLEFEVLSDARKSDDGYLLSVSVSCDGQYLGKACLDVDTAFERGDIVEAVAGRSALGDSDWARSRYMQGEVMLFRMVRLKQCRKGEGLGPVGRMRAAVLKRIAPEASDARALMAGLLCGYSAELNSREIAADISRTGLSHLVAVSGSHLAVVSALVSAVLSKGSSGSRFRCAATLLLVVLYALFTGLAVSALRSCLMVAAGFSTSALRRRRHTLSGLALAVVLILIFDPGAVCALGFQLSCASVLFILLFGTYISRLFESMRVPRSVAGALSCTLCAQAATLPITLPVFGSVSLVSPLANLIVGPLVSGLLCVCIAVAPLFFIPVVGTYAAFAPLPISNLCTFFVRILAGLPYASVPVEASPVLCCGTYFLAALFFLAWPRVRLVTLAPYVAALCLAFCVHIGYWGCFAPPEVCILDVGQADAILIRQGASTMLVDAGVDDDVLLALARNKVFKLDAVVITHWDEDHWGGLPFILTTYPVGQIYVAEGAEQNIPEELEEELAGKLTCLDAGDSLNIGNFKAEVVWPVKTVEGTENGQSLCLDVRYGCAGKSLSLLLTGDTEIEEELLYADSVGDIDVLKLGHHGSKVSVNIELLDILKPELAVASAGENNSYGHPSSECIAAVDSYGANFACTKDAGDVHLYPGETGAEAAYAGAMLE